MKFPQLLSFALLTLASAPTAFADGSRGCPDDAVKFVCQCVENSHIVSTTYSNCIDQTSNDYDFARTRYENRCESQATDTKDCRVIGPAR